MTDADLPTSVTEVPTVLSQAADLLASGALTRDEADDYLSQVLGLDELWAGFPPDHVTSVQDSWTRLFDGREAERDRALAAGDQQFEDEYEDRRSRGPSPVPDVEGDLHRQALEALALAEKRRVETTHDASIRTLLETIMGESNGSSIDKTKYDFVSDSGGIDLPSNMHPDAAKTVCKAEYYTRSIDTARTALLLQPRKPEFPYILWNDLLRNQYVDFGKILGHLHSATETTKLSERLGDNLTLVTTTSRAPLRKVSSFGDWCYVWTSYRSAVIFVFNHRGDELDHWFKFISQIFGTTGSAHHANVIEMEAAMRRFIFANQSRCFWDHLQVLHLQHAYLGNTGSLAAGPSNKRSNSNDSSRPPKKPCKAGPSGEICRRFNRGDACRGDCIHEHKCSKCGGEHAASACTQASSSGSRARGSQ